MIDKESQNAKEPEEPLVSVIMNCRNGEEYLREAIDSVYAQTYGNWEIVFFDNVSEDGSPEIARSYGEKLQYYRSDEKLSLGAARNAAMARAKGKFIAFLDTDDIWFPEKLARQVSVSLSDEDVGFVYTNYYLLHASTGKRSLGLHGPKPEGHVFGTFLGYYPVNLQTVMVRSSCLLHLDELFDPYLEYAEEYDFFMRILISTRAKYLAQTTACYRIHDKMMTFKLLDRRPVEMDYILEKFRRSMPDLDKRYPCEVALYGAKVAYFRAVAFMHRGDAGSARAALAPYRYFSLAFFVLHAATFSPGMIWKALMKIREKVK